ncbi:SLIT2 [Branchiostoma lanceolatum]|uniref:SLIT2 protein n=1 Tax=Branchiostoma lanceolatum TaxID=7740 RepID=A0A8J9YQ83_BRALA|nr:SLIT2 [Branchiostoma lanceolatum]
MGVDQRLSAVGAVGADLIQACGSRESQHSRSRSHTPVLTMQGPRRTDPSSYQAATKLLWVLVVVTYASRHAQGQAARACDSSGRSVACTCNSDIERVVCSRSVDLKAVPSGIPTDTVYLDLNGNKLTSLPRMAFQQLSKLRAIVLSRNEISDIQLGAFDGLDGSLTELQLQENKLTNLKDPKAFAKIVMTACALLLVTRLIPVHSQPLVACDGAGDSLACKCQYRSVSCRRDDLTEVPTGVPNNTLVLEFWWNKITAIPRTAFVNLFSLSTLQFDYNKISSVEVGAFDRLSDTLKQLTLNNNELETLEVGVFRNLTELRYLDLGNNMLSSLSNVSRSLWEIDVDCTCEWKPVYDCPDFSWFGPIVTCQNPIRLWADSLAEGPKALANIVKAARIVCALLLMTHLVPVHGEPVVACDGPGDSLACKCQYRSVYCKYDDLKEVPTGLPNDIVLLDLRGNKITSVPRTAFVNLSRLSNLKLHHNKISSVEVGAFDWQSGSLNQLALNSNELESLETIGVWVVVRTVSLDILRDVAYLSAMAGLMQGLEGIAKSSFKAMHILWVLLAISAVLVAVQGQPQPACDSVGDASPVCRCTSTSFNPLENVTCGTVPSQDMTPSLEMFIVSCTREIKPLCDCPNFTWIGAKTTCAEQMTSLRRTSLVCDTAVRKSGAGSISTIGTPVRKSGKGGISTIGTPVRKSGKGGISTSGTPVRKSGSGTDSTNGTAVRKSGAGQRGVGFREECFTAYPEERRVLGLEGIAKSFFKAMHILWVLLAISAVLVAVQGQPQPACDSVGDASPVCRCTSTRVNCKNAGLTDVPTDIPPGTRKLDLSGNKITPHHNGLSLAIFRDAKLW